MKDIFEEMRERVGCTYISDLPYYKAEAWARLKEIEGQCSIKELDEFCRYTFSVNYQLLNEIMQRKGK